MQVGLLTYYSKNRSPLMKKLFFGIALIAAIGVNAATPVYLDDSKPLEDRVEDALNRMTLREKINLIHAQSKFSAPGVPRLGIPEIWCTDGPMGVRPEVLWDEWEQAKWTNDSCTAFQIGRASCRERV